MGIQFEKVNFFYARSTYSETRALVDIDLNIDPGDFVAVIGHTGSGKSTLVNLIPRLYDITEPWFNI